MPTSNLRTPPPRLAHSHTLHRLWSASTILFPSRLNNVNPHLLPAPTNLPPKALPPAPDSPLTYENDPAGLEPPLPPPRLPSSRFPKRKRSTSRTTTTTITNTNTNTTTTTSTASRPTSISSRPPPPNPTPRNPPLSSRPPNPACKITPPRRSTAHDTPWDTPSTPPPPATSHPHHPLSSVSIPPSPYLPKGRQFKLQTVTPASPKRRVSAAGAPASLHESTAPRRPWLLISESAARAGRNRWAAAVICATNRRPVPPSARHVSEILAAVREGGVPQDRATPVGAVFYGLTDRMVGKSWVVSLKSAIVLHMLFRVGNPRFVQFVAVRHGEIFEERGFLEAFVGAKEGRRRKEFARGYAMYLGVWLRVRREGGLLGRGERRRFLGAGSKELLKVLPKLLDLLEVVGAVEVGGRLADCELVKAALSLVVRDVRTVLGSLHAGFKRLVSIFFGLDNKQAVPALGLYARFQRVAADVKPVLKRMRGDEGGLNEVCILEGLMGRMKTYVETTKNRTEEERGKRRVGASGGGNIKSKQMGRNLSLLSYRPSLGYSETAFEDEELSVEEEQKNEDKKLDPEEKQMDENEDEDEDSNSFDSRFEIVRVDEEQEQEDDLPVLSDIEEAELVPLVTVPHLPAAANATRLSSFTSSSE